MGLTISSLINNLTNNEVDGSYSFESPQQESENLFVRKIINPIKNTAKIIPSVIYNINKGKELNNENLGIINRKVYENNLNENSNLQFEDYSIFCVSLDNSVIGFIKTLNSDSEVTVQKNIKKLDDFILNTKISYLKDIGFSHDYIYSWVNLLDNIDKIVREYDLENGKEVFKTVLLKKGKNIPVSYDRKIATLKIVKIKEL